MNYVEDFENLVKQYFGSPYAVAIDCCTHAIELCLRMIRPKSVMCPKQTYVSIPMTFTKLNIPWRWTDAAWQNYYFITNTNIVDAAVYWKKEGYIKNTLMCLSFQFKKHLSLGRGGMILLDNHAQYQTLKKMRYDGRSDEKPWAEQKISMLGYHYYMTPEIAQTGISKFKEATTTAARAWAHTDYPDLSELPVFKGQHAQ